MQTRIGLIGLSTMGANLAKNFADQGIEVVVFNRSYDKTVKLNNIKNILTTKTIEEFYNNLGEIKIILLLVKAGQPTNDTLDSLKPFLTKDDVIIDLGNANYMDSKKRQIEHKNYFVCGISGGEKGARYGASLMLSGPIEHKDMLINLFSKVSALDFYGGKTVGYFGEGVVGNIVKTVHNGIEYAQMQVLSELYTILRFGLNKKIEEIEGIFKEWSISKKDYLSDVMSQALSDPHLIDHVLPILESKGTGKWTAELALKEEVYSVLIPMSYNLRMIEIEVNKSQFATNLNLEDLSQIYDYSYQIIVSEGLRIIKQYQENIDINEVKRVWQGGCIIRNYQLENNQFQDIDSEILKKLQIIDYPLPLLNTINQNYLISKFGLNGSPLLAIARDVFGSHGFYNLEREKVYLDW
jgi:6-phosphogluconate dehydrogenase